jgi:hypothetical protein
MMDARVVKMDEASDLSGLDASFAQLKSYYSSVRPVVKLNGV